MGINILDCTMKNDEIEARDRAELIFVGSIPVGEYERDCEVEATAEGLVFGEVFTVPWEWIDKARTSIPDAPSQSSSATQSSLKI